ncbi:MAG: hypothetical protein WCT51_04470 [Candidatus Shapirobacteria bacterium]|jgi:hypothetical protein
MKAKSLKKFDLENALQSGEYKGRLDLALTIEGLNDLEKSEMTGKTEHRDYLIHINYSEEDKKYYFEIYSTK